MQKKELKITFKVATIITRKNNINEVLLILENTEKQKIEKWNVIKGTWKTSKETIFEAIARECQEEASINVKVTNFLGCFILKKDERNMTVQFNFLASALNNSAKPSNISLQKKLNENIKIVKWFKKSDILKMNKDDFLTNRTYLLLHYWIEGKIYPLELINSINIS